MSKQHAVECNEVIGIACKDCTEPCIMKFNDAEWKAYSRFSRDIASALQERDVIDDDINEYWKAKEDAIKQGVEVEDVININISYLRRRKKEVEQRINKLRKSEYYYTKKLLERQKG